MRRLLAALRGLQPALAGGGRHSPAESGGRPEVSVLPPGTDELDATVRVCRRTTVRNRRTAMRHLVIAVAVALTAALAVSSTGHAAGSAAALKTRHGKIGTFLVDGSGRTLYLFQKDKTPTSKCSG